MYAGIRVYMCTCSAYNSPSGQDLLYISDHIISSNNYYITSSQPQWPSCLGWAVSQTLAPARTPRLHWSVVTWYAVQLCGGLFWTMICSLHNSNHFSERKPPDLRRLLTWRSIKTNKKQAPKKKKKKKSHTQSSYPTECICQRTFTQTPGDPQSVQLDNAATATTYQSETQSSNY